MLRCPEHGGFRLASFQAHFYIARRWRPASDVRRRQAGLHTTRIQGGCPSHMRALVLAPHEGIEGAFARWFERGEEGDADTTKDVKERA